MVNFNVKINIYQINAQTRELSNDSTNQKVSSTYLIVKNQKKLRKRW